MIGAIIGDMVGSAYEFHPIKRKDFTPLFHKKCRFTDDTVMSLAVCHALFQHRHDDPLPLSELTVQCMHNIGNLFPNRGYGGRFRQWLQSENPQPYGSFGNGSAMRVSGVAHVATSLEEVKQLSHTVTAVTHNHPEGLKGAEATAVACYMALHGSSKAEIRAHITANYYPLDFTLDEIRPDYGFSAICQTSVPEALQCFFESTDFEDCLRNCVSLGGDADTQGAIAGAIAECYYGVPQELREQAESRLNERLLEVLHTFEKAYPSPAPKH